MVVEFGIANLFASSVVGLCLLNLSDPESFIERAAALNRIYRDAVNRGGGYRRIAILNTTIENGFISRASGIDLLKSANTNFKDVSYIACLTYLIASTKDECSIATAYKCQLAAIPFLIHFL